MGHPCPLSTPAQRFAPASLSSHCSYLFDFVVRELLTGRGSEPGAVGLPLPSHFLSSCSEPNPLLVKAPEETRPVHIHTVVPLPPRPSPETFHHPQLHCVPIKQLLPISLSAQPLVTTVLLLVSRSLTIVGTSNKWDHTLLFFHFVSCFQGSPML